MTLAKRVPNLPPFLRGGGVIYLSLNKRLLIAANPRHNQACFICLPSPGCCVCSERVCGRLRSPQRYTDNDLALSTYN